MKSDSVAAVMELSGVQWISQKSRAEAVLMRRPGVLSVEANPIAQTATIRFNPAVTTLAELTEWIRECGYHCNGRSVPAHLRDSMELPCVAAPMHHVLLGVERDSNPRLLTDMDQAVSPHETVEIPGADYPKLTAPPGFEKVAGDSSHGGMQHAMSPHDAMGHGGHSNTSMASMVADMRHRFLVAAIFSIPILLWSPIGRSVFGFTVAAPFGLRNDVWSLLLSLPVVLWASSIFFDGAYKA